MYTKFPGNQWLYMEVSLHSFAVTLIFIGFSLPPAKMWDINIALVCQNLLKVIVQHTSQIYAVN
jgi:hypothetical protein